jgi:hypothetical protein
MSPAHAQLLDKAVRGALAPVLRDYARGAVDQDAVVETAKRRANVIRETFRAGLVTSVATIACAGCRTDVPNDDAAFIGGKPYCSACAPKFRRAPPARVRP